MASSPKAPAPVDNTAAAQSTALSNLNFAQLVDANNKVNTVNQNGSVKYSSEDRLDNAAYTRALDHWRSTGANPKTKPSQNEFVETVWTQTESLNPTLRRTLTDQQTAGEYMASAQRDAANKARNSLKTNYTAPNVSNYLKNLPALDQSKLSQVKAYDSKATLSTNLADGLDRLNVDNNKKVGAFNSQNTNLDTNVNDNLSGVGTTKDVGTNLNNFNTTAKVDTNVGDNLANVGSVQSIADRAAAFQSKAKTNTNVDAATAGAKALNQDGAGLMADFKNTAGNVQTALNSNAKIDGSLTDNLRANNVNMAQQSFNQGGSKVKTAAPTFDESVSDKYAKAAYEAQMSFMRDDMAGARNQEANRLALQGLGVDSEASKGAMSSVYNTQAKQLNQLANQSVLTGNEIARANYGSQLAGFQAGNDAEAQRYAQELQKFNANQSANAQAFGQNQQLFNANNSAQQQIFENDATRANFANSAQQQKFNQQSQAYQNNLNAKQTNQSIINDANAARNQAFNQGLQKFAAGNEAQQQQFGMDQAAYQQRLAQLATNADLTNQNNQAQAQRYSQATNNFNLNNAANAQQFDQQNAGYQNYLAQQAALAARVDQNNSAQAQRYSQATNNFNLNNSARNAQFAQNVERQNQNIAQATTNAQLQQMDNQNALQQQQWRANNLNFYNQAKLQQEALNQQDFQNQIAALSANMGLRDANNSLRTQALNEALTRYNVDTQAGQQARYRALNEYQALMNGSTPVSASGNYQNYSTMGNVNGVNYMGAAQANAAQQQARYQAQVGAANATNQSLASLAGTAAMFAFMPSDKNLKKNIQKTGQTDSGRNTYEWEWNKTAEKNYGLTGKSQGVIAQENPDLAIKDPLTGFLAVDYGRLNTQKKRK